MPRILFDLNDSHYIAEVKPGPCGDKIIAEVKKGVAGVYLLAEKEPEKESLAKTHSTSWLVQFLHNRNGKS